MISIGVIVAAIVLTFQGILRHGFMERWDDDLIYANPHLQALTWENVRWAFTDISAHLRHVYMPLSWVWWSVVNRTLDLTPEVYHSINLLVHLLNAVLVFLLVRKVLLRLAPSSCRDPAIAGEQLPASDGQTDSLLPMENAGSTKSLRLRLAAIAGMAALFWALHPLRVEPVAWAITQKFLIATLLVLLSLFGYLRRIETTGDRWLASGWHWLSLACFVASLLFYPIAFAWPAVLAVVEFAWPRPGSPATALPARIRGIVGAVSPFAVCSLLAASVPFILARPEPTPAIEVMHRITSPWIYRTMEAAYIWVYFAWKPLVPLGLSPIYTTLLHFDPWSVPFVSSLAALLAITALVIVLRRRHPWALILWLCHLLLLIPVLGIGQSTENYPNDRYSYLPGICGALLAGLLLAKLAVHRSALVRRAWAVPCVCLLAALAAASQRQAAIWRHNVTFFAYLLKLPGIDNDRFDLHWRLAEYHLAKGNHPAARETLDRALAIRPQDPTCWFLLAVVGDATGDELLAEQSARRSLELKVTPEACRLLARIYLGAGNFLAAGPVLKQALDLQPDNIDSHFLLAVMLAQQGLVREAVDELDQILAVRPGHTDAQALRAELLQGPNHIGPTFRR